MFLIIQTSTFPIWCVLDSLWIVFLILWSSYQVPSNIIHQIVLSWLMTLISLCPYSFIHLKEHFAKELQVGPVEIICALCADIAFIVLSRHIKFNFKKPSAKALIYFPLVIIGSAVQARKLSIYGNFASQSSLNPQLLAMLSMVIIQFPIVIDYADNRLFNNRSKIPFYSSKKIISSSLIIIVFYSLCVKSPLSKMLLLLHSFHSGVLLFIALLIFYILIY